MKERYFKTFARTASKGAAPAGERKPGRQKKSRMTKESERKGIPSAGTWQRALGPGGAGSFIGYTAGAIADRVGPRANAPGQSSAAQEPQRGLTQVDEEKESEPHQNKDRELSLCPVQLRSSSAEQRGRLKIIIGPSH